VWQRKQIQFSEESEQLAQVPGIPKFSGSPEKLSSIWGQFNFGETKAILAITIFYWYKNGFRTNVRFHRKNFQKF
jgi:hypothetical protein